MQLLFLLAELWPEKAKDVGCTVYYFFRNVTTQKECQEKCVRTTKCTGIVYSHNPVYSSYCYTCENRVLTRWYNDFGFYRRPTGNIINNYISYNIITL